VGGDDPRITQGTVRALAGAEAVETVEAAERVHVCRVRPEPPHQMLEPLRVLDSTTAEHVRRVVLDPASYDRLSRERDGAPGEEAGDEVLPKLCEFAPGVGFRFSRPRSEVDLLVCFECDQVAFRYTTQLRGALGDLLDIDLSRAAWVRLAKAALPHDTEIQAVSEDMAGHDADAD
jgi:hypothetical protein